MAIITISRGAFSRGEEVAEKVARRLSYRSVSNEVISEASRKSQVPENRLERAIHDPPSIFERFFSERQKHIAYVAAEMLTQFIQDDIVYHGLAGHFFASRTSPAAAKILGYFKKDNVNYNGIAEQYYTRIISHLLNVRIVANMEDRVHLLMKKRELGEEQAARFLKREDHARNSWSRHYYGVDDTDNGLYDLVLHLNKLTVDDAVDIICDTATKPRFRTSFESQQAIEDLALAVGIKAVLMAEYPGCEVVADRKAVEVYIRFTLHSDTTVSDKIRERVSKMPGVASVSVILIPGVLFT
jgi:hypothetical protein